MSETFRKLVDEELDRHKIKGRCCKGWHEAYGLLAEEVDEFWDEVKKKSSARNRSNALKELVQIAAICERFASDLALIDDYELLQASHQKNGISNGKRTDAVRPE